MAPCDGAAPSRRGAAVLLALSFVSPAASRVMRPAQAASFLVRGDLRSQSLGDVPAETCVSLKNRASYFTVKIGVGTPPQMFDVVADTGSDAVIVDSCMCVQSGVCNPKSKCFQGTNKSSTFSVTGVDLTHLSSAKVPVVQMTFGSGPIEAIVASDVVRVGSISADMQDGVLLMISQQLQHIKGPFEGILGLGLPRNETPPEEGEAGYERAVERAKYATKGFLQEADVPRFSLCFGSGNKDGALRLAGPAAPDALASVGKFHWGLDLRGVSVGNKTMEVKVNVCDRANRTFGQETACGAIPDSGTTIITAPAAQLKELFNMVCDSWPLCAEGMEIAERKGFDAPKHAILNYLLERCDDWLNETGLDSLPTLSFDVAGADGRTKTLRLSPESYILQFMAEEVHIVRKHLEGLGDIRFQEPTGKRRNVCSMAFSANEYVTRDNGPIWILGLPLFFEYTVGYHLDVHPPAVSFVDEPCSQCPGPQEADEVDKPLLIGRDASVTKRGRSGRPRLMSGPMRIPHVDTSLPL